MKLIYYTGKDLNISGERVRQQETRTMLKIKKIILSKNIKQDLI